MPTSGTIDPGKSIAYQHKQSDVEILKDVLPARWLVVGPSGAGKGVVLQNLCTRLFTHNGRSCFERIVVFSPTAILDKSTWGPVKQFIEERMDQDLQKEPAFYEEFDVDVLEKTRPSSTQAQTKPCLSLAKTWPGQARGQRWPGKGWLGHGWPGQG